MMFCVNQIKSDMTKFLNKIQIKVTFMSKCSPQVIEKLRSQLPPYDSSPEIKELIDLQTAELPDNKMVHENCKFLHQDYTIDALITKLEPDNNKNTN